MSTLYDNDIDYALDKIEKSKIIDLIDTSKF